MSGAVQFDYPGTNVPVNHFGLRDYKRLAAIERAVTDVSLTRLQLKPLQGDFGLEHLKEIHKAIFSPVYPWAGHVRDHGLSKQGSVFNRPETFEATFASIQDYLVQRNHFKNMRKDDFAKSMAFVYGKLNDAHPFREGNGRSTRYFMERLAEKAGYELDFSKVSKEEWNLAAVASFQGHGAAMEQVFLAIASPARAVLFDSAPRDRAVSAAPELAPAFDALDRMAAQLAVFQPVEREKVYAAARRAISGRLHAGYLVTRDSSRHQAPLASWAARREPVAPRRPMGMS